jgi:hypothetical protein
LAKLITKFDPVTNRTPEEAEDHYMRVHTQFARRMFRDHTPNVTLYVINRAVREYSISGYFNQKPRSWRWVVSEFTGGDLLPAHVGPLLWRDHGNTLKNLQLCPVEEQVMADRRNGQTALVKILVQHDRKPDQSPDDAAEFYEQRYLPVLQPMLEDAFGFRLFVSNKVIEEADVEPSEEEGQIITERFHPTTKHAYDEIWFDNETWAAEFFSKPEVFDLLFGELDSTAYLIEEETGLDRR